MLRCGFGCSQGGIEGAVLCQHGSHIKPHGSGAPVPHGWGAVARSAAGASLAADRLLRSPHYMSTGSGVTFYPELDLSSLQDCPTHQETNERLCMPQEASISHQTNSGVCMSSGHKLRIEGRQSRATSARNHDVAAQNLLAVLRAMAVQQPQGLTLQEVAQQERRTGDAGRAGPHLAEDMTPLRRRMAGVIWRLGVTCCMHTSSSGEAHSSLPVSSWMLGSPSPSPACAESPQIQGNAYIPCLPWHWRIPSRASNLSDPCT